MIKEDAPVLKRYAGELLLGYWACVVSDALTDSCRREVPPGRPARCSHYLSANQSPSFRRLHRTHYNRPDIVFAVLRLVRFNNNPGLQHYKAADQVLYYLYNTRTLAL